MGFRAEPDMMKELGLPIAADIFDEVREIEEKRQYLVRAAGRLASFEAGEYAESVTEDAGLLLDEIDANNFQGTVQALRIIFPQILIHMHSQDESLESIVPEHVGEFRHFAGALMIAAQSTRQLFRASFNGSEFAVDPEKSYSEIYEEYQSGFPEPREA